MLAVLIINLLSVCSVAKSIAIFRSRYNFRMFVQKPNGKWQMANGYDVIVCLQSVSGAVVVQD